MDHQAGRDAVTYGLLASSGFVATKRWGIDPKRCNRRPVRWLLALAGARPTRSRLRNRAVRAARDVVGLMLGTDFRSRRFGTQLFLPHPYGIVVHAGVVLGDRCTLFQHVTIGENTTRPGVPVLGDDVIVGAGAVIMGAVNVGDGARVGANAVVLDDVEPGTVVVGNPARPVDPHTPIDLPDGASEDYGDSMRCRLAHVDDRQRDNTA